MIKDVKAIKYKCEILYIIYYICIGIHIIYTYTYIIYTYIVYIIYTYIYYKYVVFYVKL